MKSGWRTLPPEIVFEILRHFLPGLNLPIIKPQQFPWYLGQICTDWRNVFVSYPQFWSTLVIDLADKGVKKIDFEYALSMVDTSLRRCRDHPVSFRFNLWGRDRCPSISQTPEALYCGQILDAMVAHSAYWQDAYFSLHIFEFEKLCKAKNRLSLLRSFQCQFMYDPRASGEDVNMEAFTDLFVDALRLTRIYLSDGLRWNINWSSVNTIHFFTPLSPNDLLCCLQQAGTLEELAIRTELSPLNLPDAATPFYLPFLKILQVPSLRAALLFHTPSLEELYIRDDIFPSSEDTSLDSVSSSSFEAFPTLRKLSFYASNGENFKKLIQLLPPARDIYLHIECLTVLEALSECPRARGLEALTLRIWYLSREEEPNLQRIICSWERQSCATAGFGPMENLLKLSLILAGGAKSSAKGLVDALEHHISGQGIEHSIHVIDREASMNEQDIPRFDVL